MLDKVMAVSFTLPEQIEIERIVMDRDKQAAFEFVKKLNDEFKRREKARLHSGHVRPDKE